MEFDSIVSGLKSLGAVNPRVGSCLAYRGLTDFPPFRIAGMGNLPADRKDRYRLLLWVAATGWSRSLRAELMQSRTVGHLTGTAWIANEVAPFYIICLAVLAAAVLMVFLWIALTWLGMAFSLKLRREILAPWLALSVLALPPIPLFLSVVALIDKEVFATNLFPQMLKLGASGFFIVLTNACLWLFLAGAGPTQSCDRESVRIMAIGSH